MKKKLMLALILFAFATCFDRACSSLQLTITDSFGFKHDVMTKAVFIESDKSDPNELGHLENEEHVYERVSVFKSIKETEYKIAAAEKTIALFESFLKGKSFFKDNGVVIRSSTIKHFFLSILSTHICVILFSMIHSSISPVIY
jgi:hypothetical protein